MLLLHKLLIKGAIKLIIRKSYSIKDEPLSHLERLKGVRLWKLRVEEYRAIILIDTRMQEVNVLKIGHRKDVYKRI